jgi:hypothetical protein
MDEFSEGDGTSRPSTDQIRIHAEAGIGS